MESQDLFKKLVKKLECKELTLSEFEKECARWTIETLDSYAYQPLPVKSQLIEAYEHSYDKEEFLKKRPEVIAFWEKTSRINWENWAQLEWLKHCKEVLKDEPESVERLEEKINDYPL
jgi:hypothetical protein